MTFLKALKGLQWVLVVSMLMGAAGALIADIPGPYFTACIGSCIAGIALSEVVKEIERGK
jgi:hypothetical protein